MFRFKSIWVLFLTLFLQGVNANIFDLGQRSFETIGKEQFSFMTSIAQDKSGFMWFGTQNGLTRFDGYTYQVFNNIIGDPTSLSDNYVLSLLVASDGRLWVGTASGGISVYHSASQSFTRYQFDKDNPKSLSHNRVFALAEDDKGGIWAGTENGLNFLAQTQTQTENKNQNQNQFIVFNQENSEISGNRVYSLRYSQAKTLWVGTLNGLNIVDTKNKKIDIPFRNADGQSPFDKQIIRSLLESHDHRIWVGTKEHGVHWIIPGEKYETLPLDNKLPGHLSNPWVITMNQPSDSEIWLGTIGGGISVFDTQKNRITQYINHNSSTPFSINSNDISSIYTDLSGLIWVGTWQAGLNRTNLGNKAFRTLFPNGSDEKAIINSATRSILEIDNGQIWIGTNGRGIDILDPNIGVIKHFGPTGTDLHNSVVTALSQSDSNTVWIGTRQTGIYRYDIDTEKLTNYAIEQGLNNNSIRTLNSDKNSLWIGTNDGLNRLDLQTKKVTHMERLDKGQKLKLSGIIAKTVQQKDGTLWLTTGTELLVLPANGKYLLPIKPEPTIADSISGEVSFYLSIDNQDRVWVSTNKGLDRLTRWDGSRARFERIPLKGNMNLRNGNFQFDPLGNAWKNHVRIDGKTWQITALDKADGVNIGSSFATAQAKTKKGILMFGGATGLLLVDPKKYTPWKYKPPLLLTSLNINNQLQAHDFSKTLTLKPEIQSFSLEFSALDYSAPQKNKYSYKLEGYDKSWNHTDSEHRVAKYTNLAPNHYRLMIKGTNRLDQFSPFELSIPIIQLPAWYQTTWFKILISIIAASAIYLLLEYRTRVLKQRTITLENLVDDRTRDIKSILEAIQQGILAIEDDDGKVGPEHSEYLETLAETKNIAGRSFYELLFQNATFNLDEKSQIMAVISASVGEDEVGFQMNSHLLPREALIEKENQSKIYELDWNPITKNGIVAKILLVVRDVTELRALEKASKKQRHEMEVIQEIINVPADKFHSMINSCYRFIGENRKIINTQSDFDLGSVQHLFRNMHTMKGLARSYSLRSLSEAAHIAEQYYSQSVESKSWNSELMLEELDKAQKIIDTYKQVNSSKLGRSSVDFGILPVEIATLESNLEFLAELNLSDFSNDKKTRIIELKQLFSRIVRSSLEQVINDQVKSAASLARQLGKTEPLVTFKDPGFSINQSAHELVNNIFTHLIRNAIDHGLETPSERIKAQKPEKGLLSFILEEKNSQLCIRFQDDGRGLNLQALYDTALEKGIINKADAVTPDFIANLIFTSGFSTAKQVTNISGRGVGMDAVKNFLEDEDCSISIRVPSSSNELTFSPAEFIITLPPKFFQYMG